MRESLVFEVRLQRFGVWHAAVGALATMALATTGAWAIGVAPGAGDPRWVLALAALLALGTIVVALALVRIPTGMLSNRLGEWTYHPDSGPIVGGAPVIALDFGSFLLLRLDLGRHRHLWLPLQRRGLERDWRALRCALYSTPSAPPMPAQAPAPPSE